MKAAIAGLVLAIYQFFGIKAGPNQDQLEQALLRNHSQAEVEIVAPFYRPSQPIEQGGEALPLGAVSAYAVDADTMAPLFSLNPDKPLPIASITKIGTALVLLKDHSPDQIITVPPLPAYSTQDALLPLTTGEQFRFDQLLAAALIPSDNDAADSLALTSSGSLQSFSTAMNQLTSDWGIDGAHFSNPSGLVDTDNYATAKSLAKLANLGLKNQLFAHLTSTPNAKISDLTGRSFDLKSTNELLGSDPRISGIKTGFTAAAGQCFVGLATIKGHKVITVVLGSSDRFGETKQLLDWIERNWGWE